MSINKKQFRFSKAVASLINYAYSNGYTITMGDAYRDARVHGDYGEKKSYSHPKSTHKKRLAIDLNLFKNGKYITSRYNTVWKLLHDYWEVLGGSEMIQNDVEHFSFAHEGVR